MTDTSVDRCRSFLPRRINLKPFPRVLFPLAQSSYLRLLWWIIRQRSLNYFPFFRGNKKRQSPVSHGKPRKLTDDSNLMQIFKTKQHWLSTERESASLQRSHPSLNKGIICIRWFIISKIDTSAALIHSLEFCDGKHFEPNLEQFEC